MAMEVEFGEEEGEVVADAVLVGVVTVDAMVES